jgi:hypothetical protein
MKTIMRNLTGATLVAVTALGMGRPQGAAQEVRMSDIRAQQPEETIYASGPCQRARETPGGRILQRYPMDPGTFVQDLNTLMEKSDEVILAATLDTAPGWPDTATVISPSGGSTATYDQVRVIRSWKGPHHAGDVLTFGRPGGLVDCKPGQFVSTFDVEPKWNKLDTPFKGPFVYVLFLKHAQGDEAQLVQGLLPAAGEGLQGIFWVKVPTPPHPCCDVEKYCTDVLHGSVQHCDSLLQTSRSPVMVPYAIDPLAKRYRGMPFSDFLQEVQSLAGGQ